MVISEIFNKSVLTGITVMAYLAAVLWAGFLTRRTSDRRLRFLVGFVGLIALYQSTRILNEAGFILPPFDMWWSQFAGLIVSVMFLIALPVIAFASRENRYLRSRLRLEEADETFPANSSCNRFDARGISQVDFRVESELAEP